MLHKKYTGNGSLDTMLPQVYSFINVCFLHRKAIMNKTSICLFLVLLFFSVISATAQVVTDPVTTETDRDWLAYDNGTAHWFTWHGARRAVWFDVQDFIPGAEIIDIYTSQVWFYHDVSYPWDVSDVYIELWNGSVNGPVDILDQSVTAAAHYAPAFIDYEPPVTADRFFWCVANTGMSAGGWPSMLGDSNLYPAHSFEYDTGIWWSLSQYGEYFMRITQTPPPALQRTTWAQLKTVF